MKILKKYFGKTKANDNIYEYTLINDTSSFVSILNYGGIITEICVPDKNGKFENVVLSLDNIKDYQEKSPYFGCLVGRVAGRISNASFFIDDIKYTLQANNNNAVLHGGSAGFDKQIWDVKEIIKGDSASLELSYLSHNDEQGFPGNLNVKSIYIFNNNDELEITYQARTDKKTLITLTNHSYFNLSGNYKENILNHNLTINADKYGLIDSEIIPKGISSVDNSPFDFRNGKRIGQDIYSYNKQLKNGNGYDHPFLLNNNIKPQIILKEENSGRILEITTDQPAVILYTGNSIGKGMILRGGLPSDNHLGVCLETQWYPNAINTPYFPTYILKPNEEYTSKTIYAFKIKQNSKQ